MRKDEVVKRAFIDANVILRYLTKDPSKLAEAAFKTFDKHFDRIPGIVRVKPGDLAE